MIILGIFIGLILGIVVVFCNNMWVDYSVIVILVFGMLVLLFVFVVLL